jgi:hypothetical protein
VNVVIDKRIRKVEVTNMFSLALIWFGTDHYGSVSWSCTASDM